jgi:hypothetical protein
MEATCTSETSAYNKTVFFVGQYDLDGNICTLSPDSQRLVRLWFYPLFKNKRLMQWYSTRGAGIHLPGYIKIEKMRGSETKDDRSCIAEPQIFVRASELVQGSCGCVRCLVPQGERVPQYEDTVLACMYTHGACDIHAG